MPRRANQTSFGAKDGNGNPTGNLGNGQGGKPATPGPGRRPRTFYATLERLIERKKTIRNIEKILDDHDHAKFDKMLEFAADRVYGKVPQQTTQDTTVHLGVVLLPAVQALPPAPPDPALEVHPLPALVAPPSSNGDGHA